tara:strand:- start:816 stop:1904 length:1089 start_codon:yes stop_codon:yes gene_type:complete
MEKDLRYLVREALAFGGEINEIDWEDTFQDVKKTCMSPDTVVEYLNKVRANAPKDTKDREKFTPDKPYVHAKSSFYKKEDTEVDIDHFIKKITEPPINIINKNEKIDRSGTAHEYVYKTGVPALRGIVYDIDKGKFYTINTCPGAGACIAICYARKGFYITYPASYDGMTRRLNYLLNYPDKYEAQMYNELKVLCHEHKALEGYKSKVLLRWNDSGDFFAKRYVKIAEDVMARLKGEGYNIDSYAYTKVSDVASNSNVTSTFSSGGNKKQSKDIDPNVQKMSLLVPKKLFKDLDLMRVADELELKDRVATFFNLNLDDVITYDEMMSTPKSETPKWNVIVTPNDGDDAAFRPDVKNVLQTQH